jgi:TPR repeat protein
LRKGQGVAKDPKALQKMALAADTGLTSPPADTGDMLLGRAGRPILPPLPSGSRAAAVGHPVAAFQLAQLYETGNGVPKDIEAARRLYEIAAKMGVPEAAERLKALPPPASAPAAPQQDH